MSMTADRAGESLAVFQRKLLTGYFKKEPRRGKTENGIKVGAEYEITCYDLNWGIRG